MGHIRDTVPTAEPGQLSSTALHDGRYEVVLGANAEAKPRLSFVKSDHTILHFIEKIVVVDLVHRILLHIAHFVVCSLLLRLEFPVEVNKAKLGRKLRCY